MFPDDTVRMSHSLEKPAKNGPLMCRSRYQAYIVCTANMLTPRTRKPAANWYQFPRNWANKLENSVILAIIVRRRLGVRIGSGGDPTGPGLGDRCEQELLVMDVTAERGQQEIKHDWDSDGPNRQLHDFPHALRRTPTRPRTVTNHIDSHFHGSNVGEGQQPITSTRRYQLDR
jgi:hypothetical protein